MAEIYDPNGNEITVGLESSEAIRAAKRIAKDREEEVYLDDDNDSYVIYPDGRVIEKDEWTHEFYEAGNGFPEVGDEVVCDGEILVVRKVSRIHTNRPGVGNSVYLVCEETGNDIWDRSEEWYADAYRVAEIDE